MHFLWNFWGNNVVIENNIGTYRTENGERVKTDRQTVKAKSVKVGDGKGPEKVTKNGMRG